MLLQRRTTSYCLSAVLIVLALELSCSRKAAVVASSTPTIPNNLQPAQEPLKTIPSSSPTSNSPIRKVDFRNFTYPEPNYGYLYERVYTEKGIDHLRSSTNTLHRLINGTESLIEDKKGLRENNPAGLASLEYADVTGDGKEEALIELGIAVRGTAIPTYLYIYAWGKTNPKMLFAFETGDRADGGFRRLYADHSELIIELNAGDEAHPDCDGCQATRFTRLRYKWNGRKFVLVRSEIVPIARKVGQ